MSHVEKGEAWNRFWDAAAQIAVNQARRTTQMGPREAWDCEEINRRLRRCDRALRELRAALRDLPEPNPLGREFLQMEEAVKRTTLVNRALKAEWSRLRPDR